MHGNADSAGAGLSGKLAIGMGVRRLKPGKYQDQQERAEHDAGLQPARYELAVLSQGPLPGINETMRPAWG